jgi:hypothetical protein
MTIPGRSSFVITRSAAAMSAVATMTAMHEEMHANTKQQREPDQQPAAQNVHPMLVTQQ